MVTTNDETLWKRMWAYKDHGKSWDAVYEREHPPGFRWLHESFGTNFRMTEMQAAIGRIQLGRMDDWHRQRMRNAQRIWQCARDLPRACGFLRSRAISITGLTSVMYSLSRIGLLKVGIGTASRMKS